MSMEETYRIAKRDGVSVAVDSYGDAQLVEFGTTCTVAIIRNKQMWVAHVGDSMAVRGRESLGGIFEGVLLTSCHNGCNPVEVERIQRHHASIRCVCVVCVCLLADAESRQTLSSRAGRVKRYVREQMPSVTTCPGSPCGLPPCGFRRRVRFCVWHKYESRRTRLTSAARWLRDVMGADSSSITDDGYVSVDQGQWRGTQLAVTRALSHQLLLQAGVVPEPEVRGHRRCSYERNRNRTPPWTGLFVVVVGEERGGGRA
jgi:hypothetical protein